MFADPVDAEAGLAPEMTAVRAAVDAACNYTVDPGVGHLVDGDAVLVFIDTDGDPRTGDPVFAGADTTVVTLGGTGSDDPPVRGTWDGTKMAFTDSTPVGTAPTAGAFTATVDRLSLASGLTNHIIVATAYDGVYDTYFDFAPDAGLGTIPLTVDFSTTPPVPPAPAAPPAAPTLATAPPVAPVAPVAPAPAVPPPAAPTPSRATTSCVVPAARRMSAGRARALLAGHGCRVASATVRAYSPTVRAGSVIRTIPSAGSVTVGGVRLVVSRGKKRRRARSADMSRAATLNALVHLARRDQAAAQP